MRHVADGRDLVTRQDVLTIEACAVLGIEADLEGLR